MYFGKLYTVKTKLLSNVYKVFFGCLAFIYKTPQTISADCKFHIRTPFHIFISVSKLSEYYDINTTDIGGIYLKIESNGEEKITVALTTQDLCELDITYDEMDYSNIETRRVIWTILDVARRTLGKAIDTDGRLLIEALPADDGGCTLIFTSLPIFDSKTKKRLIMKKESDPLIFCPFDENAFLDALATLNHLKENIKSCDAVIYNELYYIIIRPKLTFSDKITLILSEFGNIAEVCKADISTFYEHGLKLSIAPFMSSEPKM
jgi:hypothetical protein